MCTRPNCVYRGEIDTISTKFHTEIRAEIAIYRITFVCTFTESISVLLSSLLFYFNLPVSRVADG